MRLVFACTVCGVHYLPPEGLVWSDGSPASPLWCNIHHVAAQQRGVTEHPAAAAAALAMARMRSGAPGTDAPARLDVRPSRPARTRKPAKPGGRRSRLG